MEEGDTMRNISRRGIFGMLAAGVGAAIISTPGILMSIKPSLYRYEYDPVIMDMINREYVNSLVRHIIGVQPMTAPVDLMYKLRVRYNGLEL